MDRVNAVTSDVFFAIAQLREMGGRSSGSPEPQLLHQRMRSFADRTLQRGAELGYAPQDVQDIAFALVALVDEVAVSESGPLRDFWLPRTLQLSMFNDNNAGENFFQRLAVVMSDPSRAEVLRVYYLCLLLGFQGKYRMRGGEIELATVTDSVAQTLRVGGIPKTLSPHGDRPKERGERRRGALPLVAMSVGTVVVAFALYGALRFSLNSTTADLTSRIASMISG